MTQAKSVLIADLVGLELANGEEDCRDVRDYVEAVGARFVRGRVEEDASRACGGFVSTIGPS